MVYLWCWVDGELQFCLFTEVHRESLQQEGCKTRACTTPERVKNQETL